uniref:Myb-like domain-containing protein n=1 Tax=Brassica oleracea var. oleracea TaxID=109376 RepID=A0A0D3CFU2_BRAOL
MDPFSLDCSFQNLLNNQHRNTSFSFVSAQIPSVELSASDEEVEAVSDRKERRKWSPTEDVVLISAWLNTSKDAVVGNEQKAMAFWKRIAAYFGASPKMAGMQKREGMHCKQRWAKINEGMAHEIFFNDYKSKFTMEHAWLELRHDQKWCGTQTTKDKVQSKRRKLDDLSAQSSTSVAGDDEAMARPEGVKAAKARGKKGVSKPASLEEEGKEFKSIWEIKQRDFDLKDKLNKQKLLDSLIAKTEPLSELEIALKNKLITDMLAI